VSWREVGLVGTRFDCVKAFSHGIGKRVALHAWWISGGTEEVVGWSREWGRVAEGRGGRERG
jgi:hypothetical protein